MSRTKLKLLTFDAVNTIIKVRPRPAKQYADVAKKFGMTVVERNIEEAYENSWNDIKLRYPNYGKHSNMTSRQWWKIFILNVFKNAGYSEQTSSKIVMDNIANELYKRFSTRDSWAVCSGVREILPDLKAAGLKLAVVSNFDERLSALLNSLCLEEHFDFLVTSVSAQAEKPDARIFEHALKQAGVKPEESIHVGDSLEEDFIPARNVGIRSYLFVENNGEPSSDVRALVGDQFIIRSFQSFRNVVLNLPR